MPNAEDFLPPGPPALRRTLGHGVTYFFRGAQTIVDPRACVGEERRERIIAFLAQHPRSGYAKSMVLQPAEPRQECSAPRPG